MFFGLRCHKFVDMEDGLALHVVEVCDNFVMTCEEKYFKYVDCHRQVVQDGSWSCSDRDWETISNTTDFNIK